MDWHTSIPASMWSSKSCYSLDAILLTLSKLGDGYCFHGDFINGWFDDAAKNMLKAKGQSFLRIDGSHGSGKQYSSCKAKDSDPGNGTSDFKESLQMMRGG